MTVKVCPICGSRNVVRNGTISGKQRYVCKDNRHTFYDKDDYSNRYHILSKWLRR
jgi:transposase-like protein